MNLSPLPLQKFFDSNGEPLVGGLLYTYEAGSSTKSNTWKDAAGLTLNTNPIVLDYRGEARVWLDISKTYKFVLSPRGDTDPPTKPIWTVDDIAAPVTLQDLTQQVIGGILFPRTQAEINAGVMPVNYFVPSDDVIGYVLLERYAPDRTGIVDAATALQGAINVAGVGGRVYISGGLYQINSTCTILEGTIIQGESQVAVILNAAPGVTLFDFNPAGFAEYRGQHLWDMTLQADLVLQINRLSTLVLNGVSPSFVTGGSVKRCRLYNITANTGYAITASCIFDWVFEENKFAGTFDIVIILQGSDLNTICNNRFTAFRNYGIVDRSAASSFGSSNDIRHNDMTLQTNTNATFVLTSSLYPIIHDNYMEQIGSGTGVAIRVELINPSGVNFGANTQLNSRGIYIENNRIEPEDNFAQCIRIDPDGADTIVCRNPSSSANLGSSIFTSSGNDVPLVRNGNNLGSPEVDILGASWGIWDGFKSGGGAKSMVSGFFIDATCNRCFPNLSFTGDARFLANAIVMPTSLTAGQLVRLCPSKNANLHFKDTATISVTVVARSRSASGDTLQVGFNSSIFDSATTNLTLTEQFQKFTAFSFTAPAVTATNATISFNRTTANGSIEIAGVYWSN